jgi:hypothetical protein
LEKTDMDEDDLEGLSDQERAALEEESEDESSLKAIVGDEDEDDKSDDKDDQDEGKDDPAADPAKDVAAAQEPEPKAGKALVEHQPVVFTAAAPEDADAQITALNAQKADAFKQLMDGELSPEEYSAKDSEISGQIRAIEREVTTANVATKLTLENAQRSYFEKVNRLLDAAKDEGIDYRGNKVLHHALDATVKELAADPENADKPESWFLQTAHKAVKDSFGLGKERQDPAKKTGRAPDLSGLPPSLRNVPAAAESDDGGEFAHLNGLKGMKLEQAVAKMSPEQQQRWAEAD